MGEKSIEVGVGTRVEGIEEHQEYLGISDVDERVASQCSQTKESYRSPAGKIYKRFKQT